MGWDWPQAGSPHICEVTAMPFDGFEAVPLSLSLPVSESLKVDKDHQSSGPQVLRTNNYQSVISIPQ